MNVLKDSDDFSKLLCYVRNSHNSIYSEYSKFLPRLKTYDTYELTRQHKLFLCEAGFMFLGVKDYVQCFNCGIMLKDWKTTDDPWSEHAFFSPNCTFVLLNKGNEFINRVLNEFKHRCVEHEIIAIDDQIQLGSRCC